MGVAPLEGSTFDGGVLLADEYGGMAFLVLLPQGQLNALDLQPHVAIHSRANSVHRVILLRIANKSYAARRIGTVGGQAASLPQALQPSRP